MTEKQLATTQTELSKNTTQEVNFKPTSSMKLWVAASIQLGTDNITNIAEECGVDRKNWYVWLKKPGFMEWYEQEMQRSVVLLRQKLDNIGIKKAATDYRYFEAMQRIVGRDLLDDKNEKGPGVQVNFNANKFIKNR